MPERNGQCPTSALTGSGFNPTPNTSLGHHDITAPCMKRRETVAPPHHHPTQSPPVHVGGGFRTEEVINGGSWNKYFGFLIFKTITIMLQIKHMVFSELVYNPTVIIGRKTHHRDISCLDYATCNATPTPFSLSRTLPLWASKTRLRHRRLCVLHKEIAWSQMWSICIEYLETQTKNSMVHHCLKQV